jgi:RimJ/RimL family protein N-acetyltransferase
MAPSLTTGRLILRPLKLADSAFIQKLFPHKDIVKFIGNVPWPYPADGALKFTRMKLDEIATGRVFFWVITLKKTGESMGCIEYGLRPGRTRTAVRGFWLGLPYHSNGYMTEAVRETLTYIFTQTTINKIYIDNRVDNLASRRVKQKTGATFIGIKTARYIDGKHPQENWQLTKADWLKQNA